MNVRSSTAALTAAALLLLGACTEDPGDDGDDAATGTSPTGAPTTDSATAPSQDPGTATTGPGATQTETQEPAGEAVLEVEEANAAAVRVLTAARLARTSSGGEAEQARQQAWSGYALRAAEGADRLREVDPDTEVGDPLIEPTDANVLAVSRDDGQHPWFMVVQTVPDSGQPVLHLMRSDSDADGFRLVSSSSMLPGVEVGSFERRSAGSPVIREGEGELGQAPREVMRDLADMLAFPGDDGSTADIRTNGFAPQLREAAREQSQEVSVQADFRQSHEVLPPSVHAIERADGSALAFGVLERTDTFNVRDGMTLIAPERFTALVPEEEEITQRATMTTLEFVVLEIPSGDGPPRLLAVREQLVDAQGQ